jgi:hypothetical protein
VQSRDLRLRSGEAITACQTTPVARPKRKGGEAPWRRRKQQRRRSQRRTEGIRWRCRRRLFPALFGARVDKVGRPQEGQPASRETGRPSHRLTLRGAPSGPRRVASVARKGPAGKPAGGGTRKREPRCGGRIPGEGESPGELRARRAPNRACRSDGLRWRSKAVKSGRVPASSPELPACHGARAMMLMSRGAVNAMTATSVGRRNGCRAGARLWRAKPQEREPDGTSRQGSRRSKPSGG